MVLENFLLCISQSTGFTVHRSNGFRLPNIHTDTLTTTDADKSTRHSPSKTGVNKKKIE